LWVAAVQAAKPGEVRPHFDLDDARMFDQPAPREFHRPLIGAHLRDQLERLIAVRLAHQHAIGLHCSLRIDTPPELDSSSAIAADFGRRLGDLDLKAAVAAAFLSGRRPSGL
jgi:hypothetical protein